MSCFEFDGIVSKADRMTRLRVEVWGIGGGGGGKGMEERPGLGCSGICGAGCSGDWGIVVLLTGAGCIGCIGICGGVLLLAGGVVVCCCGTGAGLGAAFGGRDAYS